MSFINASTGNTFVDFAYSTASLGVNAGRLGANLLGVQSNLEVVGIGVGNVRRVRVWDDLYVKGDSIVAGNVSASTFRLVGSLLANRVVTTDASGNFTLFGPTVQTSQIAYLAGLTSSVQTQLDSKLSATGLVSIGNLIATGNVSAANVFANSTPNQGFFGNGRNITNMSASNLDTGTLPDGRLNGAYTGLTSLVVNGSITGGSVSTTGTISGDKLSLTTGLTTPVTFSKTVNMNPNSTAPTYRIYGGAITTDPVTGTNMPGVPSVGPGTYYVLVTATAHSTQTVQAAGLVQTNGLTPSSGSTAITFDVDFGALSAGAATYYGVSRTTVTVASSGGIGAVMYSTGFNSSATYVVQLVPAGSLVYSDISGNIVTTGNFISANIVANSTANQGFFGNGRSITNMSASNLDTGTLPNARLNTTITGLSSLTSTALAGDLTGNVTASGNISAVGNVSAANVVASSAASQGFFGNGRNITNMSASNLDTGTLPNARLNSTITGLSSLTSTALVGDLTGNVAASGTIAAATLTASANIVVGGDAIISGNLVVKGDTTTVQTTQLDVQDAVIALGNVLNATQTYAGTFGRVNGAAANVAAWYNISQKQYEIFTTGATSDADSAGLATKQWANLVVANVMADLYGNVSATNVVASSGAGVGFSGNGRSITNLSASNLDTGTLPNARLNTTITGLSSLTSTALVGDLTGNVTASGNVLVTGNVSAANVIASSALGKGFFGNGRSITNMSATNLDAGTMANDRLPTNVNIDGTLQGNAAISLGPGAKPEPAAGGALISHNAPASGTWISGSYDAPTNQQTIQIVDFGSSYPQSGLVLVYVSGTGKDGFMMASFSKSETSNPDILTILTHKTTSSGFTWGNCYLRTSGTALYANVDQNVKATSTYLGALARNVIS